MPFIKRRQISATPPNIPGEVDYPGLEFVLRPVGNTFVDLISGRLAAIASGGSNGQPGVGAAGESLYFPDQNSYSQSTITQRAKFGTGDFAVCIMGDFVGASAATVALSNDAAQSAGSRQWRLQPNNNGSATSSGGFAFLTYGGSTIAAGAASLFQAGKIYTFMGVRRGITVELWRDGVLVASSTGTVQDVSGSEVQSIGFGWGSSAANNAGGNRYLAFGIRRAVSPGEAAKLSENPWQIFAPRRRPVYFSAGSGGTINVAASGSDTASGTATPELQVALAGIGVSLSGGTAGASVAIPLAAAGLSVASGAAGDTATITIGADGLAVAAGTANLSASGNGQLAASGGDTASGSAVLAITITLVATGSAQAAGTANLNASGGNPIAGSGGATAGGSGTLQATVTLTAAGLAQALATGQLAVQVPLAGFAAAQASGSAVIANGAFVIPARRLLAGSPAAGRRPASLQSHRRPAAL